MTLSVIHLHEIKWRANITEALANRYASGKISPVEFRTELRQRATGRRSDVALIDMEERFIYPHGDRARRGYAQGLAKRLRNITVVDFKIADAGLYSTSYSIPGTNQEIQPHSSIFVTITLNPKTAYDKVKYRGVNTGKIGVIGGQLIAEMGKMINKRMYGEIPQSVNIRIDNKTSGEAYQIKRIPTRYMKKTQYFREGLNLWVAIGLTDDLTKYENEDSW